MTKRAVDKGSLSNEQVRSKPASAADYTLEISPKEATLKSTLHLSSKGFDLAGSRIEWLVNDTPFTTVVPNEFNGADAVKGAVIQARAVIGDLEVKSNTVEVVNSLPEINNVKLIPEVFNPGDILTIEAVASDADGDPVTFLYEWTRNGEAAGSGASIESAIQRGDAIIVKVTPFDGEGHGDPVVIRREIGNMPPVIMDHREFRFDGTVYTYQVRASDPDGDRLTYSLDPAVPGMTINASTGLVTWNVPEGFKGKKEVIVSASDGIGTAKYAITITIQ